MKDLTSFIQDYHQQRESRIIELEIYKWKAFKHFKENCEKKYNSIREWIDNVFCKAENLLISKNYYPLGMLEHFSGDDGAPAKLVDLFSKLLVEGKVPTPETVREFIKGTKEIMQKMVLQDYKDWKGRKSLNSYQDVHAVSVYLSMFYSNDFYIYKFGIFKEFARKIGYTIKERNAVNRLFEYQELCDEVKKELKKNVDLIQDYKKWLENYDYEDDELCLLTQDFIYSVVRHLNSESYRKIKGNKPRIEGDIEEIHASDLMCSVVDEQRCREYKGKKEVDYEKVNRRNRKIGKAGEYWAVNAEKDRLKKMGLNEDLVEYTAQEKGDGYGYDIKSVEDDRVTPRYIEVKTTTGGKTEDMYFTENEMSFSKDNRDNYHLYRVYNFRAADMPARLLIVHGGLDEIYAQPILYKAKIKQK